MKKKSFTPIVFVALLVIGICVASTVSAWGPATHAYIGKELGRKFGYLNLQEIYGAMLPDFPWIMFGLDEETKDELGYLTHRKFIKVVNAARWSAQKAGAYGFASHNEEWGADRWAHIKWDSIEPGYTKYLGEVLMANWYPVGFSSAEEFWDYVAGLSKSEDFAAFVAEAAIEYGIDILVSQNEDPGIGLRVLASASVRSWSIPWLLVRAYAGPLAAEVDNVGPWEAAQIIAAGEKQFKELLILYGAALWQPNAIDAVAEIAATQFGYLVEEPDPEELRILASALLEAAMLLCTDGVIAVPYYDVLEATIVDIGPELEDLICDYPFLE